MLPILKLGSTGPLVSQWQTFLRGQGLAVDDSGLFDAATDAATRAFQKRHKLDVDGVVGNQSFGRAAMLGFELTDFSPIDSGFPPRPAFDPIAGNAQRQALFGPLQFVPAPTASNREAIRITNGWDKANLVMVDIPQLAGIPGAPKSGRLALHRKAAGPVRDLWKAWERKGLLNLVLSFDGAFNPRFIRGGAAQQILSNHAFATAFDINAKLNALGTEPATHGRPGCVYPLVADANRLGLFWGGHFSRRDGMHFELAVVP
ncbi:MAG: M15 family metallopeptidase [Vitreoscilla sp.]|nr:M15 family metallopeptidase [Vitreoscilla sp.]